MNLADFQREIDACMRHTAALTDRDQIGQQMLDMPTRLACFQRLASQIITDVIRPRIGIVAAKFTNTVVDEKRHFDACGASFGYCHRFPTSARLSFIVEHDDAVSQLIVRYEMRMQPVFVKYEPHDKLTLEMDERSVAPCAEWVEERLRDFLKDYLRLDRGDETLDVDFVTDPVCGMRFPRTAAAGEECYRGHSYFFCTPECRQQFSQEPSRFIWFKT